MDQIKYQKLWFGVILTVIIALSCKKEVEEQPAAVNKKTGLNGLVQKGPFKIGSTLILQDLDEKLNQTGSSFNVSTDDNLGSFNFGEIALTSGIVEITATGFYFCELTGRTSPSLLTLRTYSEVSDSGTVNLNVFNHVLHGRIKKLVKDQMNFNEAKEQATAELFDFLGFSLDASKNIDHFDITRSNDPAAALLAFSLMVQSSYPGIYWYEEYPSTYVAATSEFLANLSIDFADNGKIDNEDHIEHLADNANMIDRWHVWNHMLKFYESENLGSSVADFSRYLDLFLLKNANNYQQIQYPDSALVEEPWFNNYNYSIEPNILFGPKKVGETSSNSYISRSLAANIPIGEMVEIKYDLRQVGQLEYGGKTFSTTVYPVYWYNYGWAEEINDSIVTLRSTKTNQTCYLKVDLGGHDTLDLEIYENGASVPEIRSIYW